MAADPNTGMTSRRLSYASVTAGTANTNSSPNQASIRSATFENSAVDLPTPTQRHTSEPTHTSDVNMQDSDGVDVPDSWGKRSVQRRSIDGFFKPTYLRDSKYLEKLEAAKKAKAAALREAVPTHSNPGSLSTSSSSVSLHRMAPSHRGMTYEIVEHQPPIDDDGLTPLPARWAEADKYGGLEIGGDGLEVRYTGALKTHEHEAAATRADHPMPPQCGLYYYEVTIVSKGKEGMIGVGFSGPDVSLERLPGWSPDSWAYHGDDGKSFGGESTGKSYGPTFTTGDVVGCGVNFMTGCAFFTKNGVSQGNAFRHLKDVKLYPSIGMKRPGAQLSANFGQRPFVFDIDGMMAQEKHRLGEEIHRANVSNLRPHLSEAALVKELVAQFLAHDGYVETARAFAEEIRAEARTLSGGIRYVGGWGNLLEDDFDAVNRQRIRAAILDGDVDKALKHTTAYYPQVLQNNPQIYFRLRCRKFIEMIRQCAELLGAPEKRPTKSANGHDMDVSDDNFEDMEVVDQINNGDDWDQMDTEETDHGLKYQNLMAETVAFGQELRIEFREDGSKEVKDMLNEIFAMFAYEDPRKSSTAPLLEQTGRVPVAEELNSAILVSLGKSPSAAIERLYQQTEILMDEISEEGGAGAFMNVRRDFL